MVESINLTWIYFRYASWRRQQSCLARNVFSTETKLTPLLFTFIRNHMVKGKDRYHVDGFDNTLDHFHQVQILWYAFPTDWLFILNTFEQVVNGSVHLQIPVVDQITDSLQQHLLSLISCATFFARYFIKLNYFLSHRMSNVIQRGIKWVKI